MPQLSAVIITFNEERNIGRCLDSLLHVVDDIVVVDSFSTDNTANICKEKGVRFIEHPWDDYSSQKNFANSQALYPLVFSIDADEVLSEELRQSILTIKSQQTCDAYEMNRLTNYCGDWVYHCGWYPDKKLRIFNRDTARWEGVIHEKVVTDGDVRVGFLQGDLLHYSYYTLTDHINQVNKFTDISAQAMFSAGKRVTLMKVICSPLIKFVRDYFLKLGMLDGYAGFLICRISAHAAFLKNAKLRQLWKNSN